MRISIPFQKFIQAGFTIHVLLVNIGIFLTRYMPHIPLTIPRFRSIPDNRGARRICDRTCFRIRMSIPDIVYLGPSIFWSVCGIGFYRCFPRALGKTAIRLFMLLTPLSTYLFWHHRFVYVILRAVLGSPRRGRRVAGARRWAILSAASRSCAAIRCSASRRAVSSLRKTLNKWMSFAACFPV